MRICAQGDVSDHMIVIACVVANDEACSPDLCGRGLGGGSDRVVLREAVDGGG